MEIDEAILKAVGDRWTKVAMVIAKAAEELDGHIPDDERAEVIAKRIKASRHAWPFDGAGQPR